MNEIAKEIVKIKIEKPSISITDIAKELDINRVTVAEYLKKPEVKKQLDDAYENALEILLDAQTEAAMMLCKLLYSNDPRVALGAAREILKGVLEENINHRGDFTVEFINKTKQINS